MIFGFVVVVVAVAEDDDDDVVVVAVVVVVIVKDHTHTLVVTSNDEVVMECFLSYEPLLDSPRFDPFLVLLRPK